MRVGRNRGKKQHTLDEARRLVAKALLQEAEVAAAVLSPLLMSVDGHGILDRTVRDVDDDGKVPIVPHGKTANRRRPVEIPEVLQPVFAALTAGKDACDWLFPASRARRGVVDRLGHRSLSWARAWTHRMPDAAEREGMPSRTARNPRHASRVGGGVEPRGGSNAGACR